LHWESAEAATTKAHLVEGVFKQSFCYVKGIPQGFAFACPFCFCLSLSRLLPAAHTISSEGIDGFEEHHSCSDIRNDMLEAFQKAQMNGVLQK